MIHREASARILSPKATRAREARSPFAAAIVVVGLGLAWAPSPARGAEGPNPKDWDLKIQLDKAEVGPGADLLGIPGVVARAAGLQGWSYGVVHDAAVLDILSVTTAGADVESVFDNGFNQTAIVETAGKKGFIQAIVLSFLNPAEVPVSNFFSMAKASYKVRADACSGKPARFNTEIEWADKVLGVAGSPAVELLLTVGGRSVVPEKIEDGFGAIVCGEVPEVSLALRFDKEDTDLDADQTSVYELKVHLANTGSSGADVEAWSYGIAMDFADLDPSLGGTPGADAAALRGGMGPEFVAYNLDESGGGRRGVTVGVVIDLNPPATNVLAIPAGGKKHIETLRLKSRERLAAGATKTTTLRFSDALGSGDRAVEAIVTIAGDSYVPDISDTLDLLLRGPTEERPRFIRGDANNDARVDIADGVWIVNELFYGGRVTRCRAAADANDDAKVDLADALYILRYQLQPGSTPSNLYPKPPAPFPGCGTAPNVTFAECPAGSTVCMP